MSVEGIIEKILGEARNASRAIVEGARKEAEGIRAEERREAAEYYEKQRALLEEQYRKEKERAVLNKRLETRKNTLGVRQQWLERAFDEAYKALIDQPLTEYKETLLRLIGAASKAKDEEIVFGRKGSKAFFEEIVSELKKGKGAGEPGPKFTLSPDSGDFPWGFILRKGKVEVNMSIDSLFKYRRTELEQKAWEMFDADN
jgi:vacuolar-type H+-ATPase subunit E/Vma4